MLYIKYTEIRIIFAVLFLSLELDHMDTKMVKNRQRLQMNHQEK